MHGNEKVHVDNYTRFCLTAIAGLLTVLILMLWVDGTPCAPSARAGELPYDSAASRQEIVDAAKETNHKLGDLIDLLKSGQAKIQMVDADGKNGHK
jgi:hypothetical protein